MVKGMCLSAEEAPNELTVSHSTWTSMTVLTSVQQMDVRSCRDLRTQADY